MVSTVEEVMNIIQTNIHNINRIHILNREDIYHDILRNKDLNDLSLYDFSRRLSREDINKADLIVFIDGEYVKIFKNKFVNSNA